MKSYNRHHRPKSTFCDLRTHSSTRYEFLTMTLRRIGLTLCVVAITICVVLHLTTFITNISPSWIFWGLLFVLGAVACGTMVHPYRGLPRPTGKAAVIGSALLIYAVLTFVYDYRTTGGATSVGIVDGRYVSMYKGDVIRTITEYEYRMFPNLWTRVMTAWIATGAVFLTASFKHPIDDRSDQTRLK